MARITHPIFIIFSLIFSSLALAMARSENESFARNLDPKVIGNLKKEKLTHFHLYWHDIIGGNKPTSVEIVTPPTNTSTMFGLVNMIDNPLTDGPDLKTSKLVGKAQGFYASASQEEVGLLMAMNFAFTYGKYNGSSITVFGRNPIFETVREIPVIGGSGRFRFARGYAQARTHFLNLTSLDAIVEYNIYVLHY